MRIKQEIDKQRERKRERWGFFQFLQAFGLAMVAFLIFIYWVSPIRAYKKLRKNGFDGPTPNFPLGNIEEMRRKEKRDSSPLDSLNVTHNIHSTVFPYFGRWRKLHGKVFVYWLGTEPFLYVADPEFLKQMSSRVVAKSWGKPNVFKYDRKPMFGKGLVMVEGDQWLHHRNIIAPAFSPANLKAMSSSMVESANKMLDQWSTLVASGEPTIDVEGDIISTAAEIIAMTTFGINDENGHKVFEKLRAMQLSLFKYNRLVGVPFSKLMHLKQTLESRRLGKEIDSLLLSIITSRQKSRRDGDDDHRPLQDLLGLLLADPENNQVEGQQGKKKKLTGRELVDECKTFFFGGHETTALAITWTLLLLALHPEWQQHLREEIKEVIGDGPLDPTMLPRLKKMGWVMHEVLRLYPSAPNTQRQAREDIRVGHTVVPKGTNIWIDTVGIHHDRTIWGDDVNEFKPERFKENPNGGCNHNMGYLPFGFGGRICVGRNLTAMEYKIVLTLMLRRFSFIVSPNYCHSPTIMLSLRPNHGLPLVLQTL